MPIYSCVEDALIAGDGIDGGQDGIPDLSGLKSLSRRTAITVVLSQYAVNSPRCSISGQSNG